EIEKWWRGREFDSAEITGFFELVALLQPLDPQPIIQPLQGQVNLLMHLKFDHREPVAGTGSAWTRDAQDVDHAARHSRAGTRECRTSKQYPIGESVIGRCSRRNGFVGLRHACKCRHLWIDKIRQECGINFGQIAHQKAFKPALALKPVKLMGGILRMRMASVDHVIQEFVKLGGIILLQFAQVPFDPEIYARRDTTLDSRNLETAYSQGKETASRVRYDVHTEARATSWR